MPPAPVTREVLDEVVAQYGLQDPQVLGQTEAGVTNQNWLIAVAGSRYFLRGWSRAPSLERIRFQLDMQGYLLNHGYPAARAVKSRAGADIVEAAGIPWVLFEYIEGEEYDSADMDQARLAGKMLASFHKVAEGFKQPTIHLPGESFEEFLSGTPAEPERLRRLFAGRDVEAEVEFTAEWWEWFLRRWPPARIEKLPGSWVHYDYHGRNVLFRDGAFAGLFDFDLLGRGTRALDVARGLFSFARSGDPIESEGEVSLGRGLRRDFARAFMDGYQSELELEQEEIRSLAALAGWSLAPSAYWYSREYFAGRDLVPRLKRDASLLRAVDSEMRLLAPEFGWETR